MDNAKEEDTPMNTAQSESTDSESPSTRTTRYHLIDESHPKRKTARSLRSGSDSPTRDTRSPNSSGFAETAFPRTDSGVPSPPPPLLPNHRRWLD